MLVLKRAIAVVAALLLTFVTATLPAQAATQEAIKAADWILSQDAESTKAGLGSVADDTLALAATSDQRYAAEVTRRVEYLKTNATKYVADQGAPGAAKLAIIAMAVGSDPKAFGDVDLVAAMKQGIKADGAVGAFPGPFASGLVMVALARAGEAVPESMVTYLLTYKQADNSFAYAQTGNPGDADNTAMAVLGLKAAKSATDVVEAAVKWLESTQLADGSWAGYAPVNSTAITGALVSDAAKQKALEYLKSKQLESGAFPTGAPKTPAADLIATQQAVLALADTDYERVKYSPAEPSPSPTGGDNQTTTTTAGTVNVVPALLAAGVALVLAAGVALTLRGGSES